MALKSVSLILSLTFLEYLLSPSMCKKDHLTVRKETGDLVTGCINPKHRDLKVDFSKFHSVLSLRLNGWPKNGNYTSCIYDRSKYILLSHVTKKNK